MSWFEFHNSMREDPRISDLSRSLRLSIPYTIGHIALLYGWAASEKFRAFTGNLSAFTPEKIAEAAGFPQDGALRFVKDLCDKGIFSRDPSAPEIVLGENLGGQTEIVGWQEFCGDPVLKRIGRQQQPDGSHAADDWLGSLLSLSGSKAGSKPYKLLLVYKYMLNKKNKKAADDDERWDELELRKEGKQFRYAKLILDDGYKGDLQQAAQCVVKGGDFYNGKGLFWDLKTIHDRMSDIESGRMS